MNCKLSCVSCFFRSNNISEAVMEDGFASSWFKSSFWTSRSRCEANRFCRHDIYLKSGHETGAESWNCNYSASLSIK